MIRKRPARWVGKVDVVAQAFAAVHQYSPVKRSSAASSITPNIATEEQQQPELSDWLVAWKDD